MTQAIKSLRKAILKPSELMYKNFPRSAWEKGIFVGRTKDGKIKVIKRWQKTVYTWDRLYWLPAMDKAL